MACLKVFLLLFDPLLFGHELIPLWLLLYCCFIAVTMLPVTQFIKGSSHGVLHLTSNSPLTVQREGYIEGTVVGKLWWWRASSHYCRCQAVADEIEEQGDILRYMAAVLTKMTYSSITLCVFTSGRLSNSSPAMRLHVLWPSIPLTKPPWCCSARSAHLSDSWPFSSLLQWTWPSVLHLVLKRLISTLWMLCFSDTWLESSLHTLARCETHAEE